MSYIGMESGFHDYSDYKVRNVKFDGLEFIATLYKEEDRKIIIWEPSLELIAKDFEDIKQAFLNFGKPPETSDFDYGKKYKAVESIKRVVDGLVRAERERLSGKRNYFN